MKNIPQRFFFWLAAAMAICALRHGVVAANPAPDSCDEAAAHVAPVAEDAAATKLVRAVLGEEIRALPNPAWRPGFCRAVADNLVRKRLSRQEGVVFDAPTLIRTSVKYEAFRIATFRAAGVAPKLYFGFMDGRGRTTRYEKELLRVASKAAPILNAYAEKNKLDVRVTAKEIAVTQIAEGGALLLTGNFANVDHVPPVQGVGLDDYRIGFKRFPGLREEIDAAFGTRLGALNGAPEDTMSFAESILGTAVMYLYEKNLAEEKRRAESQPPIATLPLDEQFVVASLVYNSGILFSKERVDQILAFNTAAYLADISERSADRRPRLPVMSPEAADAWLAAGKSLPEQRTSWNAVYHVLQRYGAWSAISRFSPAFAQDGSVKAML